MGGPTLNITIIAWANVLVAAGAGWWGLFGLVVVHAPGPWGVGAGLTFVWAVAQLSAGLRLLDGRPWARLGLIWSAALQLALLCGGAVVSGGFELSGFLEAIRSGAASWSFVLFEGGGLLLSTVVAIATLLDLTHPRVRAQFGVASATERRTVGAVGVAVMACIALRLFARETPTPHAPPPPTVARQPSPAAATALQPIEPGTGAAVLRPTFNGKPVEDFGAGDVQLSLVAIDEKPFTYAAQGGSRVGTQETKGGVLERPWRVRRGRIRVSSVPSGVYRVRLTIDRNHGNEAGREGDLSSFETRAVLRTGHGTARAEVALRYVMAIREPKTAQLAGLKSAVLPRLSAAELDAAPRVPSHVFVRFDPVPDAVGYTVVLECPDVRDPEAGSDGSSSRQAHVQEPSWEAELPPCPAPYAWQLLVSAYAADGRVVGQTTGSDAFVVEGTPRSRAARGLRNAALTLRPTFAGRPVTDLQERDVWLELATMSDGGMTRTSPRVRMRHGRIKLPVFAPGINYLTLAIGPDAHDRGPCYGRAGNLVSKDGYFLTRVPPQTGWRPESRVVALQRTMQLVEPKPAEPAACSLPPPAHVRSPVTFRWEPLPEAVEYRLRVYRKRDARNPEEAILRVASWQATLPPTDDDDFYQLSIDARGSGGRDVGTLVRQFVVE